MRRPEQPRLGSRMASISAGTAAGPILREHPWLDRFVAAANPLEQDRYRPRVAMRRQVNGCAETDLLHRVTHRFGQHVDHRRVIHLAEAWRAPLRAPSRSTRPKRGRPVESPAERPAARAR